MADVRTCTKCKLSKPFDEFYPVKRTDGSTHPASRCKACVNERVSENHKKHPEVVRAAVRRWAKKNPDAVRKMARDNYKRHAASRKANVIEYQKKNPERVKQWRRTCEGRRRAQKVGGIADPIPAWVVERLFDLFDGFCAYCKNERAEHVDHVQPLSKGGAHSLTNLLPSCPICNFRKHNEDPHVWAAKCGVDLAELLSKAKGVGSEPPNKQQAN